MSICICPQVKAEPEVSAAPVAKSQQIPSSCPFTRVAEQGEVVRKLKAEKAPKVYLCLSYEILLNYPTYFLFVLMRSCFFNVLLCLLQDKIDAAVKELLARKAEFKQLTGQDYKPDMTPPTAAHTQPAPSSSSSPTDLYTQVAAQGELVRKLKTEKAAKVNCCYTVIINSFGYLKKKTTLSLLTQ